MPAPRLSRVLTVLVSTVLTGGVMAAMAGPAFADESARGHASSVIFVAPKAAAPRDSGRTTGCGNAPFSTIQAGVNAAAPGQKVVVCPGTYTEDVSITKPVVLHGQRATINATGLRNGVVINSSHVTLEGFTVTGALGEGVLVAPVPPGSPPPTSANDTVAPVTDVTVQRNHVTTNNLGGVGPSRQCPETPAPPLFLYPGDCGGGINLDTAANSHVQNNVVTGNDDGILVTDDFGPTYRNVIARNYVANNIYECGIVLPSHNAFSVAATQNPDGTFTVGAVAPSKGGVYDNLVIANVVIDNGTGPGAFGPGGGGSGVGAFAPSAGTAAYDNTVAFNFITGSGQAGFTIHAHYPGGEYVSGNRVIANTFGPNNLGGDFLDGPGTDPDTVTTGVLVFSAVPVHMVIAANHIDGNQIGIWLTPTVTAAGLASNSIVGATTPIYVSHVPYAFTGPALDTTAATATVGVLINPNGSSTTYFVEYGTSTTYTSKTAPANAGAGILPEGFPVHLSGVTAGQTIHYQVVATNANGTRMGGDMTFTAT